MNAIEIRNAILTSELTANELRILSEAIKTVRERVGQDMIGVLAVDDRVQWTGKSKVTDFGIVKKVARTTVTVRADSDGQLWRIPASMLQRA